MCTLLTHVCPSCELPLPEDHQPHRNAIECKNKVKDENKDKDKDKDKDKKCKIRALRVRLRAAHFGNHECLQPGCIFNHATRNLLAEFEVDPNNPKWYREGEDKAALLFEGDAPVLFEGGRLLPVLEEIDGSEERDRVEDPNRSYDGEYDEYHGEGDSWEHSTGALWE